MCHEVSAAFPTAEFEGLFHQCQAVRVVSRYFLVAFVALQIQSTHLM